MGQAFTIWSAILIVPMFELGSFGASFFFLAVCFLLSGASMTCAQLLGEEKIKDEKEASA